MDQGIQHSLKENSPPKKVDVVKGGIDPFGSTAKPWGLASKSSASTDSKPKGLQISSNINRSMLFNKSNKTSTQIKSAYIKKEKIEEQVTVKNEDTLATSDIITTTTTTTTATSLTAKNEHATTITTVPDEDEPQPENEDEQIIQDFFDDNENRYEEDEEDFIDIVPVLPIQVPERLKHLYVKQEEESATSTTGVKRSHDDADHDQGEKKQRTEDDSLFAPDAPRLPFDANTETIELEREQEARARHSMMQTTQSLREDQWNDPMLVAEYASEIFAHLFDIEPSMMADPGYASNSQHALTWRVRSVLIDWIIEIHYLFGLLPETFFLAVNIIDRFLSMRSVALGKLQLVGITSLFIATKFEEIVCPTLGDFLMMTDYAISEDDLIKAERFILQNLDFRLCYPNPLNFLRRICTEELECDVHTRTLCKYFMEVTAVDHRFIGIRPSKIAAASLWLSRKMLLKGKWNAKYTKQTGYTAADLKPVVETMLDYLSSPITHDAFFKKWSSKKFSKASIFVRDWINRYYLTNE